MSLKKTFSKDNKTCKVTFSLPTEAAPSSKEVRVVGDFNNWNWEHGVVLKKGKKEYSGETTLAVGRDYEFRYLIDNSAWDNDWAADGYRPSPFQGVDNSIVAVPATESQVSIPTPKASAKKATPKAAAPIDVKPDDLTKIEGIGPKINGLLNAGGYNTFADLSVAKVAGLKKILNDAGSRYTMHDPTTWPKQAKLAAQGQWEVLAKLQDELKGGKVVG